MAKKKNKLNKSNSSGWLDNFSEELVINKYAPGGPIELPNDSGLSPSQIAQLNTLKKQQEYLSSDKAKKSLKEYKQSELSKKAQEKQSTVSTKKEKSLKDKVKEAAYNPLATLTGTETGNKYDEFLFGTPAMMANSAINTVGNVFSPSAYGAVGKGLVNMAPALANMALDTDYQPVFNDGSSERALEIGTDALTALPFTQAIPKGALGKAKNLAYNYINPLNKGTNFLQKKKIYEELSDTRKLLIPKKELESLDAASDVYRDAVLLNNASLYDTKDAARAIKSIKKRLPNYEELPNFNVGKDVNFRNYVDKFFPEYSGKWQYAKNDPKVVDGFIRRTSPTGRGAIIDDLGNLAEGEIPESVKNYIGSGQIGRGVYSTNAPDVYAQYSGQSANWKIKDGQSGYEFYMRPKEMPYTSTKERFDNYLSNFIDAHSTIPFNMLDLEKKFIRQIPEKYRSTSRFVTPIDYTSVRPEVLSKNNIFHKENNYWYGYSHRPKNTFERASLPEGLDYIEIDKVNYDPNYKLNKITFSDRVTKGPDYIDNEIFKKAGLDTPTESDVKHGNKRFDRTGYKSIAPAKVLSKKEKSILFNYQNGGEINQYADGGNAKNKKSTLSKLKKALSLRENLGNLNTEQGYNTPLNQILRTAVGMEGKDLSNESMDPIAREQDAFRMYLGLPSRTGAFEQTGPNKYRIRDYNKLYPDTLLSNEAVRDWGTPNEEGVPDPVNQAFDLYPYDDFVMGKHYITKGKDAKGEYLKYYDKFDLDPTRRANQYIDRNINPRVGKYLKKATPILDELEKLMFNPFELEDKVYYDPKTKLRSDIILQQNKQRVVPGQPVAIPDFAGGGKVNDNKGYLISNLDNFTPKKIINSNYITTNNMAFPVDANGVILYPNTGDYIFPTNKVIETPIMQEGEKINNDMKKKFKKYQGGGYLDYQDAYKGFGVGPNLTQDNSYYRTAVPGTIENIQEEINQPSALAGLNNVLGGIDQIASQGIGLVGNFMQSKMSGAMGDMGGMGDISYVPMEQSVANNLTQDPKAGTGLMGGAPTLETAPSSTGSYNWNMMGSPGNFNWNLGGNQGGASALSSQADISAQLPEAWKGVPFLRNGGYLKRYQEGGMTEMPVGYPEYIHKSNVFQPHVIPVPKVHFSDDTSVFDMGVNLNDLVQMNGGGISKYQYGGFMTQPRTFNSNSQRMNAAQLSAATENDFMHTKLRNDRQQFADNKVDWGFMNWAKEPTGAYLGMMSTVPILGDTVKNVLGDSFLTRTSGYQVGQGVGKSSLGAAKLVAGVPKGDVSMILGGVGDIGEGVGGAVGNLNAKSAMGDYNKQGYVSGKRLANAAVDFNTTMGLSSKLYGMGKSIVDLGNDPSAKNLQTFLNNKNPYNRANKGQNDLNFLLGQFMPGLSGDGADGGEMAMGGYLNNYQEGGMVFLPEDLEIPKYKKGGLTPTKARQMLHDKSYSTDKQRKYFGYISSQKKTSGGWIGSNNEWEIIE
jgi:hypothetical protein